MSFWPTSADVAGADVDPPGLAVGRGVVGGVGVGDGDGTSDGDADGDSVGAGTSDGLAVGDAAGGVSVTGARVGVAGAVQPARSVDSSNPSSRRGTPLTAPPPPTRGARRRS
jgi:hypothetical protein